MKFDNFVMTVGIIRRLGTPNRQNICPLEFKLELDTTSSIEL